MAQSPIIRDWVLRELVSSSKMNEQIRDVHSNAFPYLATVTGSLPYLQGVRDVGILAPPAAQSILSSDGGAPSWKTIGALIVPGTVVEAMLAADAVSEAKLKVSNAPSDGDYLRHKDSATGMAWRTPRLALTHLRRVTAHHPVSDPLRRRSSLYDLPQTTAASYIAFAAVRSYSEGPIDENRNGLPAVTGFGPLFRESMQASTGTSNPYASQLADGDFSMQVQGSNLRLSILWTPARSGASFGSRLDVYSDFYGLAYEVD